MALGRITDPAWLAPGGWISVESGRDLPVLPDRLTVEAERRFGKAYILLLRRQ